VGDPDRLRRALAAVDAANADDPNAIRVRGRERKKELAHAELASEWVDRLDPQASDALRLAARAHHVRRWTIPREEYPADRAGYHRWRVALRELHARTAGEILSAQGYEAETVQRVQAIVRKEGLARDPEVQTFEDALCLVFLETQFADLATKLAPERLLEVTHKTLCKMSDSAIQHARGLPLEPAARTLLERALESGTSVTL
jgi:hypothetical protein